MAVHRIHVEALRPDERGRLLVDGDEAHHAVRVKRLGVGGPVELCDGRGRIARGHVAVLDKADRGRWVLSVDVDETAEVPPLCPAVNVWAAAPKGPRLEVLIDQLSQVGAAAWTPLRSARSVVDPREGKLDRMRRLAAESAKQCGRAWALNIHPQRPFEEALAHGDDEAVILADAGGEPYQAPGADSIRLLIGPEGGWTAAEIARACEAGVQVARFGPHVMRVETAAVVAAAHIIDAETQGGSTFLSQERRRL